MASTEKKRKSGKSQKAPMVRPIFLVAGAVALVGFGIVMGASLDFLTRPEPVNVTDSEQGLGPKPSRSQPFRPPQFLNVQPNGGDDIAANERVPEFLDTDSNRAWAPVQPDRSIGLDSPVMAYAVPSSAPSDKPVIAIVIDDMGLDRARTLKMMELDGPLTVSLMTYARGLSELTETAHKAGHEVMGHLPMEPMDSNENPGPGALLTTMDDVAIRQHVGDYLDKWQGYVGINNHMGSKFTADAARMSVVMEELKARGLMWLDSKTTVESAGTAAAAAANVPFVERDVFLDNVESVSAVLEQLAQLEQTAKSRGFAIGIGHPHDSTIQALKQWLPTLRRTGISLVPVTEILKRRERQQGKSRENG